MGTQSLQQPSSKPRPALRLVGTKQLPREDWLAVRKQGIGSSDVHLLKAMPASLTAG